MAHTYRSVNSPFPYKDLLSFVIQSNHTCAHTHTTKLNTHVPACKIMSHDSTCHYNTHTHTCTYTHTHTRMHIHAHMHIHTHAHTECKNTTHMCQHAKLCRMTALAIITNTHTHAHTHIGTLHCYYPTLCLRLT